MKKIMSVMLAVVMCMTLCVPVFAEMEDSVYLDITEYTDLELAVAEAEMLLQKMDFGFLIPEMEDEMIQDGVFSYVINGEQWEQYILPDGQREIHISNDQGASDVMSFDDRGRLVAIDGTPVGECVKAVEGQTEKKVIEPRNSTRTYVKKCPYGKESDYSDYQYTKTHEQLAFEKNVKKHTASALSKILAALTTPFWNVLSVSICYNIAVDILDGDADGLYLAHEADYYWHKDGHSVPNFGNYREVVMIHSYFDDDYIGQSESVIYEVYNIY